ncbi:BTAD domain-containing putative transcriptional regulator [Microbacterium terricola]|uniref:Bacterial transcriptional activator domain-containing protein n=1 Tax=Microbacterium terricola TaxID=344163 RepID=A0ABM8DZ29_9MICO|nr:BTAD domain-containing putative transcriptional regulator [Microbacterium terricola]UYK41305.1 hypothetical protein OAU46_06650 [Microbacterium terricola]BDV30913.1 hypothetical protein Microterr_15730 [Microbacterium terricola]
MTVRVLGPLDTGAPQLSPRERTILSALLVRLGSSVAPDELADACWGADVPATWPQQVKKSISTIRARLGHEAVQTRGSEYAAGIDPEAIDAVRFERLVSTARQHALHGDVDRAVDAYQRALGLWRGSPYPDVASWEPGVVEALRLADIRDSVEEELLDARLRSGEQRAVIPTAERLVRENPLREDRWAILALANYRAGRQAEALATVRAARERLLDELGIEPGARLRDLETGMLRQDPALLPAQELLSTSPDCPYPGLAAFGPDDADLFFGREPDIEAIIERVRPGAIVTVSGPSGSGKSSLVLAGVVPRLEAPQRTIRIIHPSGGGAAAVRDAAAHGATVLVIDQAEELVHAPADEIAEFCARVAAFLEEGGAVIVTVRSDFLDRATGLPGVGVALGRGVYALAPLTADALREAVEGPARRARLRLEPGLVELVLRDAADRATTLPHVSHALRETWSRREGSTLTVDGYETAGGIAGAIAQSADTLYRSLDAADQELCRALMMRLVEREPGGAALRRRVAAAPLVADPDRRRIIERLVDARLIAADGDAIVIAHEAVATAWPRLDGWLADDAEGGRLLRALESAVQTWEADGRPDDGLLRGARLHATMEWRDAASPDLTEAETAYLAASATREQDDVRELELRAAAQRTQNRRLRWALAVAAVLLVVALVSGGVAAVQGRVAAAAAEDSLIEAVTAKSRALQDTARDVGALLAAEAYRRWPDDPRTQAALMSTMTAAGGVEAVTYLDDAEWRSGMYPIPGTDEVVAARGTTVRINDLRTGEVLRVLETSMAPSDQLFRPWVRVSADGSTIAVLQHFWGEGTAIEDDREKVYFFDASSGGLIGSPVDVAVGAETFALSSDGRFATWAFPGTVVVVERDTGIVRSTDAFAPERSALGAHATSTFTADDSLLFGNADGDVWTLDPVTLRADAHVKLPAGYVQWALVATADGTVFALGDLGILAFDRDGRELWRHVFERDGECSRITASSASQVAVCGDETGAVRVRSLTSGETLIPDMNYQLGAGGDLAMTEDGRQVLLMSATAPAVGVVRVDGAGPASERIAAGWTPDGGFSPDGSQIFVENMGNYSEAADAPTFAVWDVASDRPTFRVPEDVTDSYDGFLGGGRWLDEQTLLTWEVTVDDDGTEQYSARVIDLTTGRFIDSAIPDDTWEVFDSNVPDRVLVATEDTLRAEAIDSATLAVAGTSVPITTRDDHISDTADGTRLVRTIYDSGPDRWQTDILDTETGEVLASGLPTVDVTRVLPDGQILGADESSIARYSGDDLSRISTLPVELAWIWQMDVSADADILLAQGQSDTNVALVDLDDNLPLGDPLPNAGPGRAVLAADGSVFAVPGPSGVVLWTLDPQEHAEAACRLAGRDLTADEWQTYLSDLGPQHPICPGT